MDLTQRLQREFGDAVALRTAVADDAVDGVSPRAVAAPRDTAAAAALVAWGGREQVALVARGGATKLHRAAPPDRLELVLSTEYLTAVLEHDEGNATVTAESGIALRQLDEVVGRGGQMVPLDSVENGASVGQATLGGVVAANHFGMSRLLYGAPRDLVVGLHAALSDGRLVKAGSKVVKNVSGYDLNRIFTGSYGSLGVILQVTLRLRPQVATSQCWIGDAASWAAVEERARGILDGPFDPVALRVRADGAGLAVLARFDGAASAVAAQLERLPPSRPEEEARHPNWTNPPGDLRLRAVLPLQSAGTWARLAQEDGAGCVVWDYGLGVVGAVFPTAREEQPVITAITRLRAAATGAGGFMTVERMPSALKTPEVVWGPARSDFALMRRLKATFDPARVCAPGRFVGGL